MLVSVVSYGKGQEYSNLWAVLVYSMCGTQEENKQTKIAGFPFWITQW